MDAARERERASDAIPALLANLSGQLRIYHFQLKEKRLGRGLPDYRNFRSWNRYTKVLRRFPETLKHFQPGLLELLI